MMLKILNFFSISHSYCNKDAICSPKLFFFLIYVVQNICVWSTVVSLAKPVEWLAK